MRHRTTHKALLALAVTASVGAMSLAPAHAMGAAPGGHPLDPAAAAAPARSHDATQAALEKAVKAGGLPGIEAEVRDRAGTWNGSAGVADTATGRKRSAAEHFRAGSITKMFVATVILQLADESRLSLDDTVEKWLPGLVRGNKNDGRTITLRELLNHTSGLYSHTDDEEFKANASGKNFPRHRYDTYTPEQLVAVAMRHTPKPRAEKKPWYSNTNYVLAGMIIEKATGHSYAYEATRRIIKPLKLHGTSFPGTAAQLPSPHPVAYSRLHDENPDAPIHDATEQNMSWLGASGELISTTGDLNRFERALIRGELLPPARMKDMLEEVPADNLTGFGLGVEFATLTCGVKVVGKTGRTNGSLSGVVGTADGEHQLTFNINGDWLTDSSVYVNVIEAEFCGKAPAGTSR
ncbi:serine hydrolase domain-containing protein [Streptomyces pinistramenti]|uniref:serine hydrolase domain-containing protein n=1 Tax=Streptomyces pinistramenti TaxID=2884812 RepID=UPI001D099B4D|nr:serine hydrolase domain-containing protein [Streptomyces pinistramenti]MCB5907420.1 beta-lactamase family protein [Streptomyces pinistramenti]